jgi:hypothetical protein
MSTSGPELRIGDAEREAALSSLGEHFAAGRLTKEEYDERAEQVWRARTRSGLDPLFADLPPTGGAGARIPAPAAQSRGSRGRSRRFPLLPVLLVAVGVAVLVGSPWPVLFVVAGLWWAGAAFRRQAHHRPGFSGCHAGRSR